MTRGICNDPIKETERRNKMSSRFSGENNPMYGPQTEKAQGETMINESKGPSKYWCHTCKHKKWDPARNNWYCPKIVTLITKGIWCATWRCGCTLHSDIKEIR